MGKESSHSFKRRRVSTVQSFPNTVESCPVVCSSVVALDPSEGKVGGEISEIEMEARWVKFRAVKGSLAASLMVSNTIE